MLKKSLIVLFTAFVAYYILSQIVHFGVFRHVYNHAPGECFTLPGIEYGSEDIQVLPNGQAFISSGIDMLKNHPGPVVGKIYLFDFNHTKTAPVELKIVGGEKYQTLNPHGLSIWIDPKTGVVYLYVIGHTAGGEVVDKFKFNNADKTLEHMRRIENEPTFHVINDLAVVGEDQFYFTNCIYWHEKVELLFNLAWGSVGFYDGKSGTLVEKGLRIPNGIALSRDKKTLYLAVIGDQSVRVYQRNADSSVTLQQSISIATIPDNLDVDSDTGDVWVGAHPSLLRTMLHFRNVDYTAPSHALRIRFPPASSPSSLPEVTEVYSNDGSQISASSVAVRYKKGLLVGSVCTRTVYCQLKSI